MEAQYGTDADEAWFAGKVMAVNAEGTCDVHYEDGDKEAGKPWSRVRAAAVDAESEPSSSFLREMEEDTRAGESTFEMEAIAALACCSSSSVPFSSSSSSAATVDPAAAAAIAAATAFLFR